MSENVIHEAGGYRVRLEVDDDPQKPYNDGGAPIWRVDFYSGRADARHEEGLSSYEPHVHIGEAIDTLWSKDDALERYLRIFHGATVVERWHSGSYWYVSCDPAHWREAMGITDEATQAEGYGDNLMDEWKAWCEGEVYIAIVERAATTHTRISTRDNDDDLHYDVQDSWWPEESVGGLYTYDWAKQSAIDLLSNYVDELSISCDRCPWTIAKVDENERWDALFQHLTGEHNWRLHQFRYGPNNEFQSAICRRSGCNVVGTGDFVNDGECEGR